MKTLKTGLFRDKWGYYINLISYETMEDSLAIVFENKGHTIPQKLTRLLMYDGIRYDAFTQGFLDDLEEVELTKVEADLKKTIATIWRDVINSTEVIGLTEQQQASRLLYMTLFNKTAEQFYEFIRL
jgi:hypothetical protein